jgi:RNA polymerase sigma factor (sigma-70 family)
VRSTIIEELFSAFDVRTKAFSGVNRVTTIKSARGSDKDIEQFSESEFESFYRSHFDAVSHYVKRRLPRSSHDEVVAAVFVVAWRKFAEPADPSLPWLYRIARYEVAHERRRLDRRPIATDLTDLELTQTSPSEEVFDVSSAFRQLSERDAELLRLVHWEELSRNDIARVFGCSVNAVNVRYHRALDRLSGAIHLLAGTSREIRPTNQIQENR